MIYVGIVGSRRRDEQQDFNETFRAFSEILIRNNISCVWPGILSGQVTIVSGGCKKGGDKFAESLISLFQTQKIIHLPDKSKLDPILMDVNPRAAYARINYARNELVARDSKNYLIAVVAPDRKGGTENTIKWWNKYQKKDKLKGELIII